MSVFWICKAPRTDNIFFICLSRLFLDDHAAFHSGIIFNTSQQIVYCTAERIILIRSNRLIIVTDALRKNYLCSEDAINFTCLIACELRAAMGEWNLSRSYYFSVDHLLQSFVHIFLFRDSCNITMTMWAAFRNATSVKCVGLCLLASNASSWRWLSIWVWSHSGSTRILSITLRWVSLYICTAFRVLKFLEARLYRGVQQYYTPSCADFYDLHFLCVCHQHLPFSWSLYLYSSHLTCVVNHLSFRLSEGCLMRLLN